MLEGAGSINQKKCSNLNCQKIFEHPPYADDRYCPDCRYTYNLNNSKKKKVVIQRRTSSAEYQRKRKKFLEFYNMTTNHDLTRKDLIITKVNR
jgi:hypothetical protein